MRARPGASRHTSGAHTTVTAAIHPSILPPSFHPYSTLPSIHPPPVHLPLVFLPPSTHSLLFPSISWTHLSFHQLFTCHDPPLDHFLRGSMFDPTQGLFRIGGLAAANVSMVLLRSPALNGAPCALRSHCFSCLDLISLRFWSSTLSLWS